MRSQILVLIAATSLAIGCSSKQKAADQPAAAPSAAQPAAKPLPTNLPATKPVQAPIPNAAEEKDKFACLRGEETRSVHIETIQPKGCKLWYSTHGDKDPVAWSSTGNAHCEKVSSTIRTNLESSGFKCGGLTMASKPAPAAPANEAARESASSAKKPDAAKPATAAATAPAPAATEPTKAK